MPVVSMLYIGSGSECHRRTGIRLRAGKALSDSFSLSANMGQNQRVHVVPFLAIAVVNRQIRFGFSGLEPEYELNVDACDHTSTTYHTYPLLTHCQFIQARNITTKRDRETSGQASHSRCYTVPTVSQQLTR